MYVVYNAVGLVLETFVFFLQLMALETFSF